MIISNNARNINRLVNDPSIRPYAGGDGVSYIDFSSTFNDIISFEDKGSAWLLSKESDGVYECHCFFLPKFRGRRAVIFGKRVIKYMFVVLGAKKLIARAPLDNKPLLIYNASVGAIRGPIEKINVPEMDWSYMAQIFTLDKRNYLSPQS